MRGQQELNAVESEGTMRSRVPVWSNWGFSGIESSGLPGAKAGTGLGVCVLGWISNVCQGQGTGGTSDKLPGYSTRLI